ncbi:DUF4369 domain-containing protein [Ferruginibacter yonginensis]|uniref:DUF4369 domain-containing protein n=1 Tax=Ferruginibacter yonginensis TaxID=1310416 RepID=A0ABV8QVR3_9BACT
MRKVFYIFLLLFISNAIAAQGYKITVTSQHKSGIAYLVYYMGSKLNIQDSVAVPNSGTFVFKGATKVQPGIYAVVFPGKRMQTDFLIDNAQLITIKVDTANFEKTQITGSPANVLFQQYQNFVAQKGKLLQAERNAYNQATTKADSTLHEKKYAQYNNELNDYRENIIKTKPKEMLSVLLSALKASPQLDKIPVTKQDSIDNYYYYKSHYWDGISFTDDRIIRTPFFLPKLESYYREVMPQQNDSIIKDIDYKLLLARTNKEMYKFLLNWFTDEYINPKYMGQDAIFVHLFDKYHSKGISNWLNEKQQETITRRAFMLMSNLVGEKAANLDFVDTAGKPTPLYGIDAPYTLLVFWDPTCGHCKEEIPKIDSFYRANWQKKGLKIYAVLSETDNLKTTWVNYINEHRIGDWINVYQTKAAKELDEKEQRATYKQLYDVIVTPTYYLLDKDKRIIAKKLSREQINDFLEFKTNQKP